MLGDLRRLAIGAALAAGALLVSRECLATTCSFSSTTSVAFGNYDVFNASPTDSTGSLTLSCKGLGSAQFPYTVTLSAGSSGNFTLRTMTLASPPDTLGYNLYEDAARTQVWGDGSSGSQTTSVTGTTDTNGKYTNTLTVYGRVPAMENATASATPYGDTVTATVTF
jgi:spore coat protein U-like protein